ncbi:4-Cys prefix domain-containing protein [Aphanothece sacrum]
MRLEKFDGIYCLNPRCSNPQNSKSVRECQACGWLLNFVMLSKKQESRTYALTKFI